MDFTTNETYLEVPSTLGPTTFITAILRFFIFPNHPSSTDLLTPSTVIVAVSASSTATLIGYIL